MTSFWFLGRIVQLVLFRAFAQPRAVLEVRLQERTPAECGGAGLTFRLSADFHKDPALKWPVMYGAAARIMSRVDSDFYFLEDEKVLFNLNAPISPSKWTFGTGKVEDLRLALVKDGKGQPVWHVSGGSEGISMESMTAIMEKSNSKILHFMKTDNDNCDFCAYTVNPNITTLITKTAVIGREMNCIPIIEKVRNLQQAEKALLEATTTTPQPTLPSTTATTSIDQITFNIDITTLEKAIETTQTATITDADIAPLAAYNQIITPRSVSPPPQQRFAQPIIQPVMYVPYVPAGMSPALPAEIPIRGGVNNGANLYPQPMMLYEQPIHLQQQGQQVMFPQLQVGFVPNSVVDRDYPAQDQSKFGNEELPTLPVSVVEAYQAASEKGALAVESQLDVFFTSMILGGLLATLLSENLTTMKMLKAMDDCTIGSAKESNKLSHRDLILAM